MKLYKLEAVRGAAAFYLVLHHTLPHEIWLWGFNVGHLLRFGQESVITFFLLSGFVIHYSWSLSRDQRFRAYFLKRFARLYVPLLVVLPLTWLISAWLQGRWISPDFPTLLGNLFMLQDLKDDTRPGALVEPYMGNLPLWSLSYEWWFYMLYFPLVTWIRDAGWRSALVFGVSIAAAIAYTLESVYVLRVLMYFAIWWSGVWLADIWLARQKIGFGDALPAIIGLGGVALILLINLAGWMQQGNKLAVGFHPFLELRHVGFALVLILVAITWGKLHWIGFDWLLWPFMFFAPISYALYISHVHLMQKATWLSFLGNPYLEWFGYLAILLVFSWWLERRFYPYMRRKILCWGLPERKAKIFGGGERA